MVDGHPAPGYGSAGPTVPFDRARLWRMVDEIRGYLAELRHIDAVMTYVYLPELLFDTVTAAPNPGGLTFHDLQPQQVMLTLGSTFPFRRPVTFTYPVTREHVEALSARLWEDAQRWAGDNITTLSELVSSITWPEETRYDQIRERLEAVADGLEVHLSNDFGQLRNNLGDWKGAAAENFSDQFYNRFTDVLERQEWLVERLLAAAAVFKGTIRYSQHALMNAVTCTWELLREQLRLRRDADRGTELIRVFLTVAAGVTSVLSAYFSGGLSAGFTFALIGEAFAGAAATLPDSAPTRTISGATAEELCNQLTDSIREIGDFVGTEYDNLHYELDEVMGILRDSGVELAVARPLLADGPSGDTFHHNTSSHYRGMAP